jgi:hypothetical protein
MVVILLSYFSTMVTVLTVIMVLLNGALGASTFHHSRAQSHQRAAFAQTAAHRDEVAAAAKRQQVAQMTPPVTHQESAKSGSTGDRQAQLVAPLATQPALEQKANEQKAKPVRVARDQRQKEPAGERSSDQGYATALGYAPESRERLAAARIFGPIGQLR